MRTKGIVDMVYYIGMVQMATIKNTKVLSILPGLLELGPTICTFDYRIAAPAILDGR